MNKTLKIKRLPVALAIAIGLASCGGEVSEPTQKNEERVPTQEAQKVATAKKTEGELLLEKSLTAHGWDNFTSANYAFDFRKNHYTFSFKDGGEDYSVLREIDGQKVNDFLKNGNFERIVNGAPAKLSKKEIAGWGESLNSVIYFATLPYKLKDPAVNLFIRDKVEIQGKNYKVLEVTFDEEGGGTDHDDQYFYWINTGTFTMDFLAYNYQVNGGGVRFRSAYNPRIVDGVLFQDYVNYKAEVGTPLAELPGLYEAKKLKELSRIETENVINLNRQ